jgi:RNA polymerase sigma factor (sigma-70 family)
MTAAQERAMFLRLNYQKYLFVEARRTLDPERATARDVHRLEGLHEAFVQTRNQIVSANLRLVVGVSRRHARSGVSLADLVSEGAMVLMRAVDAFDVGKGFKFSTYATLALIKGYARSVPAMMYQGRSLGGAAAAASGAPRVSVQGPEALPLLADGRSGSALGALERRETVERLLARLDPDERMVVSAQYGLGDAESTDSLDLTPRQLRQLHDSAMAKLRVGAK